MARDDMNSTFIAGLLVGAGVGTLIVLLTAPQSGEEVREDVVQQGTELRARVTDMRSGVNEAGSDTSNGLRGRFELAKQAAKEAAEAKRAELLAKYENARKEGEI